MEIILEILLWVSRILCTLYAIILVIDLVHTIYEIREIRREEERIVKNFEELLKNDEETETDFYETIRLAKKPD